MSSNRDTRPTIDYLGRDYNTIRENLINYVKEQYPTKFSDFNKTSFGSLMLDLVSYVGDVLSFYIDYNMNEANLVTCQEGPSAFNRAQELGVDSLTGTLESSGQLNVYLEVEARIDGAGPNWDLINQLIIEEGSTVADDIGRIFTVARSTSIDPDTTRHVATKMSEDGSKVAYYGIEVPVEIVSGRKAQVNFSCEGFSRFRGFTIPDDFVTNIVSITDSRGNEYLEVAHLAQNTVYKSLPNLEPSGLAPKTPSVLKPVLAPRRFMSERKDGRYSILFGHGSEKILNEKHITDPQPATIKTTGKNYFSHARIDPNQLLSNDKYGIAPVDTELTVTYRTNSTTNSNAAAGTITKVLDFKLSFVNEHELSVSALEHIRSTVSVYNPEPILGDVTQPTTKELKIATRQARAAQGRCVSMQDYVSAATNAFGAGGSSTMKRASVYRDPDDLRRNINLFVVSEGSDNKLIKANNTLKRNLRTYINSVKMISDSIDILDALIINIGIVFTVVATQQAEPNNILEQARTRIYNELGREPPQIGEPLKFSDVFMILKEISGIEDVLSVRATAKSGGDYAEYSHDINSFITPDGRRMTVPYNGIWEIKKREDIVGVVRK